MLNLQRGYRGAIHPINPGADTVGGLPCFKSVAEVPGPIDLAIIVRPAAEVPRAVAACVERCVPAVMIESAGFAESGAGGRALQDEIVALTRGTGTRLWGPNCNGLVNATSGLIASFIDIPVLHAGPVSFVTQTGIFAAALLNQMMEIPGFGVSKVATLGNKCDVTESDVLEYLADDDATQVIALYLESVQDGARLVDVCRELARRKPIIALKAAETGPGAAASLTHTGSLAADERVTRGLLAQAGIVRAEDFLELIDLARAFAIWGPSGAERVAERVAIMTTSGGAGVVAVDHVARAGLTVARLAPSTEARLAAMAPVSPGASNPVDVWPGMERHGTNPAVQAMVGAVLDDPGVDVAVFIFGAFSGGLDLDVPLIGTLVGGAAKPAVGWLYGPRKFLEPWTERFAGAGIPVFRDIRTAVQALAARAAYSQHRRVVPPVRRVGVDARIAASRQLLTSLGQRGRRTLTEPEGRRLLAIWGIDGPREAFVADEENAVEAAAKIGGPVAIKVVADGVTHKSDIGAVVLDVSGAADVRAAFRRVQEATRRAAPEAAIEGVLVQEMIGGAREVVLGVTRTAQFGPVVMFGVGGVLVELLGEVAFRRPPLGPEDLDRMIGDTRAAAWLGAHRGRPAGDLAALRRALLTVSDLALADLGIDQLEVNPLLVRNEGGGVIAVDSVIVLAGGAA